MNKKLLHKVFACPHPRFKSRRFLLLLFLSFYLSFTLNLRAFNLAFLSNLCNCCHCLRLFVLDATFTVSMISSELLQTIPLKKIKQTICLQPRQLLCFMHFNCNLMNSSCLSKPMAFIRIDAAQTLENCILFNISCASVNQMFTKNFSSFSPMKSNVDF